MGEGTVTNTEQNTGTTVAATAENPGGYAYRITIRMTRQERAIIGKKAQERDQSVSRYLVTVATRETEVRPEDQARLQRLRSYFDDAAVRLQSLTTLPLFRERDEGVQAASRLREVLCVLESLSAEISRRLS